jgi:hypothetical protein
VDDGLIILLLHVDDLFLTGVEKLISECKRKLVDEFEMKDLGMMHYFLGLEEWQRQDEIFMNQGKYAMESLKRFEMLDCMATTSETMDVTLYRQMVGSLMYLTNTRHDIRFVVNTLSQYMEQPREVHLITAKHVMRYLKGTLDYGLKYVTDYEFRLYGYSNSDWANNIPDQKSTSANCFSLGSNMVSWSNRKQSCVALSTVEAEYVATCATCREAVWLQKLLSGLFGLKLEATFIWCDNQSCIKFSENLMFHDRSKHIKIKYHYIMDMVQRGAVRLQYVTTEEHGYAHVVDQATFEDEVQALQYKIGVVPLQRE